MLFCYSPITIRNIEFINRKVKIMRKLLSFILSITLLIITLFSLNAFTVFAEYSDTWDNLSWTLDDEGTLTISGEGDMDDFPYHSTSAWKKHKLSIKTIVINNGVTSIGNYAFENCESIESIIIPDSVSSIGNDAFYNTAYYNNENNWENDVLYIGEHLIKAKAYIKDNYIIKKGTKHISTKAFALCNYLTSVCIPRSVVAIDENAFYSCKSLETVLLPDSFNGLDNSVFYSCDKLQTEYYDATETPWFENVYDGFDISSIENASTDLGEDSVFEEVLSSDIVFEGNELSELLERLEIESIKDKYNILNNYDPTKARRDKIIASVASALILGGIYAGIQKIKNWKKDKENDEDK